MSQDEGWTLRQEFAVADIERINHPEYFSIDFICNDLDLFITEILTTEDAIKNQVTLNKFYDNLIASNNKQRSLYVRLKWLVYLHKLIHSYKFGSIMYTLTLKGLEICNQKFNKFDFNDQFHSYLAKKVVKPYLQYLTKLCMLNVGHKSQPQTDNKQNHNVQSNNNQTEQNSSSCLNPGKLKNKSPKYSPITQTQQIQKWFRSYNLLTQALQIFPNILQQQNEFFKSELPYLSNIRKYICIDLNKMLNVLKTSNITLEQINMTMLELNRIQQKIIDFAHMDRNIFQISQSLLMTNIEDYSKQDINNFMFTPLKQTSKYLNNIALNFS